MQTLGGKFGTGLLFNRRGLHAGGKGCTQAEDGKDAGYFWHGGLQYLLNIATVRGAQGLPRFIGYPTVYQYAPLQARALIPTVRIAQGLPRFIGYPTGIKNGHRCSTGGR